MEFFNGVVDGVDEGLKTMHHEQIAVKVMGGVFADQKICKGCPHRLCVQINGLLQDLTVYLLCVDMPRRNLSCQLV